MGELRFLTGLFMKGKYLVSFFCVVAMGVSCTRKKFDILECIGNKYSQAELNLFFRVRIL